jgi:hypothetical protein
MNTAFFTKNSWSNWLKRRNDLNPKHFTDVTHFHVLYYFFQKHLSHHLLNVLFLYKNTLGYLVSFIKQIWIGDGLNIAVWCGMTIVKCKMTYILGHKIFYNVPLPVSSIVRALDRETGNRLQLPDAVDYIPYDWSWNLFYSPRTVCLLGHVKSYQTLRKWRQQVLVNCLTACPEVIRPCESEGN